MRVTYFEDDFDPILILVINNPERSSVTLLFYPVYFGRHIIYKGRINVHCLVYLSIGRFTHLLFFVEILVTSIDKLSIR